MRTSFAAVLILGAALTGCGSGADPNAVVPRDDGSAVAPGPDELVISVRITGGDQLVESAFRMLPQAAVYGDGRVLVPGAVAEIYPGPAMLPLHVATATPSQVRVVVDAADEAGIGRDDYGGVSAAAGGATTVVTVRRADGTVVSASAAGFYAEEPAELTEEQRASRSRLRAYVDRVSALGERAEERYQPTAVAILARDYVTVVRDRGGEELTQQPTPWRGPDPAGGSPVHDGRCLVVSGADYDRVRADLERANDLTPFVVGHLRYHFAVRTLLPHESACADVTA